MNTFKAVPVALSLVIAGLVISGCKSQPTMPQTPSSSSSSSSSSSGSSGSSSSSTSSSSSSGGSSGSSPTVSVSVPSASIPIPTSSSSSSRSGGKSSGTPSSSGSSGRDSQAGYPSSQPGSQSPGNTSLPPGGVFSPGSDGTSEDAGDIGDVADGRANQDDNGGSQSSQRGEMDDSGSGPHNDDIDFSDEDIFGTGSSQASGGSPRARTTQEQVAVLDERLDESMRDYDGMILKERSAVMARANEQGAEEQLEQYDEGSLYDDVLNDEEPVSARGDGEQPGASGTPEPVLAAPGAPVPGDNRRSQAEAFPPPDDIPSGNDDDVVARQIREAAMYEKDPELREKLWEEYRRYKEQTKK